VDVNGFTVRDIGVGVTEEKFVETIKEVRHGWWRWSGLLTSAYDAMKSTVEAIVKAGLGTR